MNNITKQSIKIEMTDEEINDGRYPREMIEDCFYEALSRFDIDDETEAMMTKFFTIRFDKADNSTVAVTVTASEKRN